MTAGEKIKVIRTFRGWSQRLLADKSGIHRNTIQAYEAGKVEPSYINYETLMDTMGVEIILRRKK